MFRSIVATVIIVLALALAVGGCAREHQTKQPTPAGTLPSSSEDRSPSPTPAVRPTATASPAKSPVPADVSHPTRQVDLSIDAPQRVVLVPNRKTFVTIRMENAGPDPARDIVFEQTLARNVLLTLVEPSAPQCRREDRNVACQVEGLSAGDAISVTLDLAPGSRDPDRSTNLPTGAKLDVSSPSCEVDHRADKTSLVCRLVALDNGDRAEVTIGMQLQQDGGMPGSTQLTLTSADSEISPSDNELDIELVSGLAEHGRSSNLESGAGPDLVLSVEGSSTVRASQPFTLTYTITNQGDLEATKVIFEDEVPSDLDLVAYSPRIPLCEREGDRLRCVLSSSDGTERLTFSLQITGHEMRPMIMAVDALIPGWPACVVLKERTWQHFLRCDLGTVAPGQSEIVRGVFVPVGVQERSITNTVSVRSLEPDLDIEDNLHTIELSVLAPAQVQY